MRLGYLPQVDEAPYPDEDQADAYRRGVTVGRSVGLRDAHMEAATGAPTVAALARDILGGFLAMLGGTGATIWVASSLGVGAGVKALAAVLWALFVIWLWLWKD
jgi:hypothetical protein